MANTSSRPAARVNSRSSRSKSSPARAASGFEFEKTRSRAVRFPKPSSSMRSSRDAASRSIAGILGGYPVMDVRIRLVDGSGARDRLFRARVRRLLRIDGGEGRTVEGIACPARADHERRDRDARRVSLAPCQGDLNGRRGQIKGIEMRGQSQVDAGPSAALRNVRLCQQRSLHDPGTRQLHDAVRALCNRSRTTGCSRSSTRYA